MQDNNSTTQTITTQYAISISKYEFFYFEESVSSKCQL